MTPEEEALARRVKEGLALEILYELQTGGGLAFDGVPNDAVEAQVAAIHAAVDNLRARFAAAPDRLARLLGKDGLRVLDVGAGTAAWSLPFTRFDGVRVTALDLPAELARLEHAVAAAGALERVTIVAGDAFTADPADLGTYDVVIVANVCHLFDSTRNRALLRRLRALVDEQGVLAIVDQLLELEPDWNRWCALYAVGVLHSSPGAFLFPLASYESWLHGSGFARVDATPLCPVPPLTLVTARR